MIPVRMADQKGVHGEPRQVYGRTVDAEGKSRHREVGWVFPDESRIQGPANFLVPLRMVTFIGAQFGRPFLALMEKHRTPLSLFMLCRLL